MKQSKLLALRALIEKGSASLPDEDALEAVELFPAWAAGMDYAMDVRVRYGDKLYKCVQAHTSQAQWTPPDTPALWTAVAEPGEIPVWRQPSGAQDAYQTGERVWFPEKNTTVYVSIVDNNVWEPGVYGWEVVT